MSGEEKWDWYYGDKFNPPERLTLEEKIDSIFSTRPKGSNRQERIERAIRELRDDIDNLRVAGAHSPQYYEGFAAACDSIQLMIGKKP